jgi:hypothetical protein
VSLRPSNLFGWIKSEIAWILMEPKEDFLASLADPDVKDVVKDAVIDIAKESKRYLTLFYDGMTFYHKI